jgi:hypothetical protein
MALTQADRDEIKAMVAEAVGVRPGAPCTEMVHSGVDLRYLGGGRYVCPHGKFFEKNGRGGLRGPSDG